MARAIISMSETLRLDTIAEGIETPAQIAALKDLGCEMGQGYLFARPLDKNCVRNFLQEIGLANPLVAAGRPHTVPEGLAA